MTKFSLAAVFCAILSTVSSLAFATTSSTTWNNQNVGTMTGSFGADFDAVPNGSLIDGLTTLAAKTVASYSDAAVIVRFNNTGKIDVRNGGTYAALTSLTYTSGKSYHFHLNIYTSTHTYDVYVTPSGGSAIKLASGYAFRTEQATASSLTYLAIQASTGSHTVTSFRWSSVGTGAASPSPSPTASTTASPSPSPATTTSGGTGVTCGTGCNNYYVSPSGSDTASGSATAPWKTISHAISAFSLGAAGTVIHVAPGTYSGFQITRGGANDSARLKIVCSQQWSYPSSTGCKITSTISFAKSNYVDLGALPRYGFDIQPPSTTGTGVAALTTSSNYGYAKYLRLIGNYVHDFAQAYPAHTINGVNYATGCPSSGAMIIGSHPSSGGSDAVGAEFIGNRVQNYALSGPGCNQAHGIYASGSHHKVMNNLLIKAGGSSIQYYDSDCYGVISGNTVVNGYLNGILVNGPGFCSAPGNNTIRNNIVVGTNGCGYGSLGGKSSSSGHPSLWADNLSYNNSGGSYCQLGTYDTISGSITADPKFVNPSGGDYHLQSTSPAQQAGNTSCVSGGLAPCVPSTDFDGNTRSSTNPSLGAFE